MSETGKLVARRSAAACLPPGSLFGIGDSVKVADGASKWMRERGFWIDEWPKSIDGMTFKVVADYTNLSGESAHWWLENDAVKDCGVHPQWLTPNDKDPAQLPPLPASTC